MTMTTPPSDRSRFVATMTVVGGAFGVLCCTVPLVVSALLGAGGFAGLFGSGDSILTVGLVAMAVLFGFLVFRSAFGPSLGVPGPSNYNAVMGASTAGDECCASADEVNELVAAPVRGKK